MGQYVSFHSQNHNYQDKTRKIREQGVKSEGIEIGNNKLTVCNISVIYSLYVVKVRGSTMLVVLFCFFP